MCLCMQFEWLILLVRAIVLVLGITYHPLHGGGVVSTWCCGEDSGFTARLSGPSSSYAWLCVPLCRTLEPMDYMGEEYFKIKASVIKYERFLLKVSVTVCVASELVMTFLQDLGFCVHVKHPHKVIFLWLSFLLPLYCACLVADYSISSNTGSREEPQAGANGLVSP